jgi:hypothetical protein
MAEEKHNKSTNSPEKNQEKFKKTYDEPRTVKTPDGEIISFMTDPNLMIPAAG